jgi:hypothetical protein
MKKTVSILSLMLALTATGAYAESPPAQPMPPQGQHTMPAKDGMPGKHFAESDADKDGTISKGEWQARGDRMFGDIDANKDSKISPDEMKTHHEAKRAAWKERREERREKMGEMKEKLQDMREKNASGAAPAAAPAAGH